VLFYVYIVLTASNSLEIVVGMILCIIYWVIVIIVSEIVRTELLPEDMGLAEAGYGDKKYKFLDEVGGET
jgi:hypothetical protein